MPTESPASYETVSDLRRQLDAALATRDRAAAVRVATDGVHSGAVSIPELYVCVLGPLLADVGSAWQHGAERVWEEHYASAIVRTIVESLFLEVADAAAGIKPRGETAVLACPPDEQHDLGLRMLADRMMLVGWRVYFLGADTPDRELAAAAKTLEADLVVLTVATHYNRVKLQATIDRLKRDVPSVRLAIGGPAFGKIEDWPAEELVAEASLGVAIQHPCEG